MATYSSEYEENLRRTIRDLKALDPLITNIALTEKLSKRFNHSFDPRYIKRLSGKVSRQTLIELDRTQIEQRLKFTQENYRMVRERLCEIIYWNPDDHPGERKPANKDVIEAGKNVVMLDIAVLHAEIANGLYKKPIEEIAKTIHYEPLPGEVRAVVIAAWQRGGLLPKAAVEEMVAVTTSLI
jgi:hypothetical protein